MADNHTPDGSVKGIPLSDLKLSMAEEGSTSIPVPQEIGGSLGTLKTLKDMILGLNVKTPLTIEFQNISYRVATGRTGQKTILDSLSGKFKAGKLIALMGPSGAGKSTLTNILAGYITKNIEGQILVNGKERDLRMFRKNSCYIMQEDLLLPHLSVLEAMTCSANLRLREKKEQKRVLVETVIEVLGLSECRSTRTCSLSGGQKKRLAIAQELLSNPPIMFFDEPTSGLDSASSFQCVSLLMELALGGRTIVCTIHQPSARLIEMFDRLYFVARGCCLYDGPVAALVPYLASRKLVCPTYHNPTDFIMELVSEDRTRGSNASASPISQARGVVSSLMDAVRSGECDTFVRIFKAKARKESDMDTSSLSADDDSLAFEVKEDAIIQEFSTGTINQFQVLYVRTFLSIIRDTQLTLLRLISHVAVGLLIGMLYYNIGNDGEKVQSNAGFLFFCMLFIMFTALMPTVLTFPIEMNIFLREHLNYWYSVKAYYLAKTMADMPFQILFPAIYGAIAYFMTGQPFVFLRYFLFVAICVMTSLVAQSLGLVVGASTSVESAVFLGPVTAIPILLFSGFFVTFNTIPIYIRWLSYCSYIRYSFEGAMQAVYGFNRGPLDCKTVSNITQLPQCVQRPTDILKLFDVENAKVEYDFIILAAYFFILRGLCLLILAVRAKLRR